MNNLKHDNFIDIINYFPDSIKYALKNIGRDVACDLCEIRLKCNSPIVLVFKDSTSFITPSGRLTEYISGDHIKTSEEDIKEVFVRMCRFSVYSVTDNINKGFITLQNGCRVGVYGTAVVESGRINSVRNIKGLNIRLSGVFVSVADKVSDLYKERCVNTLICGPPSSGKTTVLKDLCRTLSDRYRYRISVIDERAEFDCEYCGVNSDVLTNYPKAVGIEIAVRTLSPDIIVCDELGNADEVESVLDGLNCGVSFVMTMHCASYDELCKKNQFNLLHNNSSIDYCVFLKNRGQVDRIILLGENDNEINSTDSCGPGLYTDRSIFCRSACSEG